MIHLVVCAFGIIFSFTISSFFSFNAYFAALSLGIVSFLAHFITSYFKIPPPGNFFFIMVAAMASTYKFDLELIPLRVGLVAMGAILSCSFAFLYSVFIEKVRWWSFQEDHSVKGGIPNLWRVLLLDFSWLRL
jgi:hypothetical protein